MLYLLLIAVGLVLIVLFFLLLDQISKGHIKLVIFITVVMTLVCALAVPRYFSYIKNAEREDTYYPYVGNTLTNELHKNGCPNLPLEENRKYFLDLEEPRDSHYFSICPICMDQPVYKFIGNKYTHKLHYYDCPDLPTEENREYFEDPYYAEEAGYVSACTICLDDPILEYIGNKYNHECHWYKCPNLPAEENREYFFEKWDAAEAGYTKFCTICIEEE